MNARATTMHLRRNAAWWLHCLLAVLLVFDQVSAPLHRHHHDNGIDATSMSQGAQHAQHLAALHVDNDGDEAEPDGFHVASAPRSDSTGSPMSSGNSDDSADNARDGGAILAAWLADLVSSGAGADELARVWPNAHVLDRPGRPLPLSRPPDGRAPPLRA